MTADKQTLFPKDQTKFFKKKEMQHTSCHSSHLLLIREGTQALSRQLVGTVGLEEFSAAPLEGIICAAHKNG